MTLILFFALHALVFERLAVMGRKILAYGWKGRLLNLVIIYFFGGVSYLNLIAASAAGFELIFTNDSYSVMEYWELFIKNFKEGL